MISAAAVLAYQHGDALPPEGIPSAVEPLPRHYLALVVDNPGAARIPQAAELINRAAICLEENQIARASELAKEALHLEPENAKAWVAYAAASAGQQNWAEARAASDKAVALKPANPETMGLAYLLRGNAHATREEFSEAIKAYKQGLSVRPEDADLILNLGLAQGRSGRFEDALATYEQGVAVAPHDLEMQIGRGIMLASLDRRAEANVVFRIAAEMADAGTAEARRPISTAVTYELAGRREEGIDAYLRVAACWTTNAEVNFLCAIALYEDKQFETALPYFEIAIRLEPDNADAHFFYGQALYGLKQWAATIEACDDALALDPAYAAAYVGRGYAFARLQRADDAIASLDKGLNGITKDSVRLSRALNNEDRTTAYRYLNNIVSQRTRQSEDFQVLGANIAVLEHIIDCSQLPEVRQTAASEKKFASLKIIALIILTFTFEKMPDAKKRAATILQFLELIEVPDSEILSSLQAVIQEVAARRTPTKKRRPLWAKRPKRERELSPPEFIKRHYDDMIEAGTLTLAYLADIDRPLYHAFHNWKSYRKRKKQPIDIGFDLPTKGEMTDKLIDRALSAGIRPEDAPRIAARLSWHRQKGHAPK